ncbi:winged helix DNA-binding protein [Enterococcus sp. 5H]|uniref:winged helix DNA-binding protein n=1 Tax=Enterococcus sp. 5H TaxID=1229490 RepID=UPI0023034F25|nr:winged helix DNA-binding protein [Enterococcus sp. 5H]MDA9469883.1 hypothetical protein [Enterococcus sp. 5H]
MKALLAHYYIKSFSKRNTDLIILCLLHELRIVTAKQIFDLLNSEYNISMQNVQYNLVTLARNELIGRIRSDVDKKTFCYYLTKNGHNTIGGMYSFPKVPEYNLNHHLMVTNALIDTLSIMKKNPHLHVIQSERRQAYEIKDFNKERKGRVFSVSDFLFRFKAENGRDINWYFEIELHSKTKRRYMEGIFPKYIQALDNNLDAQLFYVTPSPYIFEELQRFKHYYTKKREVPSLKNATKNNRVPIKNVESVFERFHIIPSSKFKTELNNIEAEDTFINW